MTPHDRFLRIGWILMAVCWSSARVWAGTAEDVHTVTAVVVAPTLSMTDQTGDFSLTFNDYVEGTESAPQVVQYRVKGNTFPVSALSGVVSAKLGSLISGLEIQADVGAFTNNGTDGDILLQEKEGGFRSVGTSPVELADKPATSGAQAKVLNGTLVITWKGKATQDLSAGNYTSTLTVTLKDA
jgi:hypothetical protein